MSGVCRLGDHSKALMDTHGCPACPHPNVEGPAISASGNVNINGAPALRVGDTGIHMACCKGNTWMAVEGSQQVFVNGQSLVRKGDQTVHCGGLGKMSHASTNVFDGSAALKLLAQIAEWLLITNLTEPFDLLVQSKIQENIAMRKTILEAAGLGSDDTDFYDTLTAIGTVLANSETVTKMSHKYGIPPALLAGIVASEMDFDYDHGDYIQDGFARRGLLGGQGPGIANVHQNTLLTVAVYLANHDLHGAKDARLYIHTHSPSESAELPNSVEESAIVTAMYYHAHGGAKSPEDMSVVWAGYRTGVDGVSPGIGGFTQEGYKRNVAKGTDALNPEFKIGRNAYMSEPMFEYFQAKFR